MSTSLDDRPAAAPGRDWRRALTSPTGTVYLLLALVFAGIFVLNPSFAAPGPVLAFLKNAAPLVVLAAGQYVVIVAGEFDLSVGALVGGQVVLAAALIDGEEGATLPVLVVMVLAGLLVGLVNGLVVAYLRVPSFITTLGMMLVLFGAIRLFTGGAPTGALSESFRELGRGGIEGIPGIDQLPWSLLVLVVVAVAVAAMMRRPFGRTLLAVGDNPRASRFSGARVRRTQVTAFLLSGLLATLAAVLLGGYAGVSAQVGQGLEFVAITAVVLGGVVLGGGQGSVVAAMGGALLLQSLFTLFNQLGLPSTARPAVQGVIIIAAVAYAARTMSPRRRRGRARAAA